MKRTISLKISASGEQSNILSNLQSVFARACNEIVQFAANSSCCNKVALQHLCYYDIREKIPELGSQMVIKALAKVAQSYKTLLKNRPEFRGKTWPEIHFHDQTSVHFDKRTYTLRGESLSLYTLSGRIVVDLKIGRFQRQFLGIGVPKEAELVRKAKGWFFNLVLDLPDVEDTGKGGVLGVDMGENNLAATSSGKLIGGGKLRYERDKYLALRSRLQSNGTKSSKQLLKKASGRESRHVRHVNHEASKQIVAEAIANNCSVIAMENLANIRKHIRAGKRVRSRLHRWAWRQLQEFVEYKAQAAGIKVVYVNPAYTSQKCASCGSMGKRNRHRFSCPFCGRLAHADLNASRNIAGLGGTAVPSTGIVNCPDVAA